MGRKKAIVTPECSQTGLTLDFPEEQAILDAAGLIFKKLGTLEEPLRIATINKLRRMIHMYSPFMNEPVDCVEWVPSEQIQANDYNPNVVAPPEMKLLRHSIEEDGYTQPIVAWLNDGHYEVVDGFHRHRVGRECENVRARIRGFLPLAIINVDRQDRGDRIASTIRHNRARGKHQIEGMSDIVIELKNRNWTNERIAKQLGMDEDEILRLCQITGLADLFKDQEFSKSWDIKDSEPKFVPLDDNFEYTEGDSFRNVNKNGEQRIFHTYDQWECHKAGFYASTYEGMTSDQCEQAYTEFLSDDKRFEDALGHIITEWTISCEHYLTNESMNRIAWLGQAAMCYATGIPAAFRAGFQLLSEDQQGQANQIALKYLSQWLLANNREEITMAQALSDKQVELY